MTTSHTPADDVFYDLISIQYHALKGAEAYEQYMMDAKEHEDVRAFIARVKDEDSRRAVEAHQLLGRLTREHHGAMR